MSHKDSRFSLAVTFYEEHDMSIGELAKYYGNSRQSMWDVLKRRGCQFRTHIRAGKLNHFWRGSLADDWAQGIIEKAVLRGDVIPPDSCETCGASYRFSDGRRAIQAHHCDYNKPMDVMWLCQKCHHEWHKNNTAIVRKL